MGLTDALWLCNTLTDITSCMPLSQQRCQAATNTRNPEAQEVPIMLCFWKKMGTLLTPLNTGVAVKGGDTACGRSVLLMPGFVWLVCWPPSSLWSGSPIHTTTIRNDSPPLQNK